MDPENVLPEHPRPQLVRSTWHSLNGIFECAIQPRGADRPARFDERVLVPFPIESSLSGLGRKITSTDRIWYRRRFEVLAAPGGFTWRLHFGAVDWSCEVWLDGDSLGTHQGGYDPFSFDAGSLGGQHELVVAVEDPTDDGPQPRGKQAHHPPTFMRPFFYTPASGIWQTVWLELVPTTHIASLHLIPRGDEIRVRVGLRDPQGSERLRVSARVDGVEVACAEGPSDEILAMRIPAARRWSPDDPFLYDLDLQLLRGEEVVDHACSYFGLRDVEIRPDAKGRLRLHLNGKPIFAHGLLDQGFWPDGIYTAPSDEALEFDVRETKRLGFNMIRKHVKIEPARWYWHCDRLGLLVFQDMPNGDRMTRGIPIGGIGWLEPTRWLGARGISRSSSSKGVFERELGSMLETLSHHPSIVMWVPFNEGWGQYDAARIADLVARADPTRLVDAASGWIDPGNGDIRDVHVYHPGPRMPSSNDPCRAEVLGEWGGLGLEVEGHRWPRRPFAYRRYPTAAALEDAYDVQFAELGRLVERGLAAAVLTQTTDVEGEVNGLFTYDRAVLKLDAERLLRRNQRLFEIAARSMQMTREP